MPGDLPLLYRKLERAKRELRHLRKRKAAAVFDTDALLQLIREERDLKAFIEEMTSDIEVLPSSDRIYVLPSKRKKRQPLLPLRLCVPNGHQMTVVAVSAVIVLMVSLCMLELRHLSSATSRDMPGTIVTLKVGQITATQDAFILAEMPHPPGDYRLQAPPSLTGDRINRILAKYGSPAIGTGTTWVELGQKYGIDPAFALAFFIHESTAGTHPAWAGRKPDGTTTHNIGNIICAGYIEKSYKDWTYDRATVLFKEGTAELP